MIDRPIELEISNGLRVRVLPQEGLHRLAIGLFVGVGARHESAEDNGISHFLEHMLYRGTAEHPSAHLQNLAFERLGGTLYASTSADHTYLALSIPKESFAASMYLLGALLKTPRLGDIEVERRIVREEILEDLDERGRQIDADNVARVVMFRDHSLGYPITGPVTSLEGFDEVRLRAHMKRYYGATNMVLGVAGPCDVETVHQVAEETLGGLRRAAPSTHVPFQSVQKAPRRKHVPSDGSQTDLRLSFLGPGEHDPSMPALEMLLRVLDDGMSTRLYHRLCDEGGLVYDCSASLEPFSECSVVDIAAEVAHDRLAQVVQACLTLTSELRQNGPTTDELKKARERHKWEIEAVADDANELALFAGASAFFGREPSLSQLAARFDSVTTNAVRDVARQVFDRKNLSLVTVGKLTPTSRSEIRQALRAYR